MELLTLDYGLYLCDGYKHFSKYEKPRFRSNQLSWEEIHFKDFQ